MNFDFSREHTLTYRQLEVQWPLRLLHIPSMVSVERIGSCTYRGVERPSYAIITYTWGRFSAPRGYPALRVVGTTWEIPPVHCFSVDSFQAVIDEIGAKYEWLWLDVACIDQENEAVKMSEVARQVGIFHGAAEAYALLHSLDQSVASDSSSILADIEAYDPLGEEHIWDYNTEQLRLSISLPYFRSKLKLIEQSLRALFVDPWFTSLWTLQESILRRDAKLLSANGKPIACGRVEGEPGKIVTVNMLNDWCCGILHDLNYYMKERGFTNLEQDQTVAITNLIEKAGLSFRSAINPNVQFGAARFRETKYPMDRIYGIYGIYRTVIPDSFQLPIGRDVTMDDLKFSFASALNRSCPWIAQCFVHLNRPRTGQSWCITQNITVPVPFDQFDSKWGMNVNGQILPGDSTFLSTAEGFACPLKALWAYWSLLRENPSMKSSYDGPYSFAIAYDCGIQALLNSPRWSSGPIVEQIHRFMPAAQTEFRITSELLEKFPPDRLYVLNLASNGYAPSHGLNGHVGRSPRILGVERKSQPPESCAQTLFHEEEFTWSLHWELCSSFEMGQKCLGLILLRETTVHWRRIGICTWDDMVHTTHAFRRFQCKIL